MKFTHILGLAMTLNLATAAAMPGASENGPATWHRDTIMARDAEAENIAREAWSERYTVKKREAEAKPENIAREAWSERYTVKKREAEAKPENIAREAWSERYTV